MYGRIEVRYREVIAGAEIVALLNTAFEAMRIPTVEKALSESRRFSEEGEKYAPHVIYAYRPTATSLALVFRQSDRAIEVYIEATERRLLLGTCDLVVSGILRSLGRMRGRAQIRVLELYEENGNLIGVSGQVLALRQLLLERFSRERVAQGMITAVVLAALQLVVGGVVTSAYTAAATTAALAFFGIVSALWEWRRGSSRVRWKFDES